MDNFLNTLNVLNTGSALVANGTSALLNIIALMRMF